MIVTLYGFLTQLAQVLIPPLVNVSELIVSNLLGLKLNHLLEYIVQ